MTAYPMERKEGVLDDPLNVAIFCVICATIGLLVYHLGLWWSRDWMFTV